MFCRPPKTPQAPERATIRNPIPPSSPSSPSSALSFMSSELPEESVIFVSQAYPPIAPNDSVSQIPSTPNDSASHAPLNAERIRVACPLNTRTIGHRLVTIHPTRLRASWCFCQAKNSMVLAAWLRSEESKDTEEGLGLQTLLRSSRSSHRPLDLCRQLRKLEHDRPSQESA